MKQLAKYSDHVYALLRIMAGLMFSFHGLQKVFGVLTERQTDLMSQAGLGGLIELVGGTLVMIGLQTRWAAFICSGMMAVAYFQFHWKFQFDSNFFPIVNRGETAVLYCFVFLFIACRGGVKWSLDKRDS